MTQIVKVQSPLNDPDRQACIVYGQGRFNITEQIVPDVVREEVSAENGGKGFYNATFVDETGTWEVQPGQLLDQGW